MVDRKFNSKEAQENYLENMSLLIWQNHIIRIDRKKGTVIIGVEMEGVPYFREINLVEFMKWMVNSQSFPQDFYDKVDIIIKELAKEVIKWREEKETDDYKKWKEKYKNNENKGNYIQVLTKKLVIYVKV